MDATAEIGRNLVSRHQNEQADVGRDGQTNPSHDTKFSGANVDREKTIFPVQLTTSRIGNLTWLILCYICDDHTYIHKEL